MQNLKLEKPWDDDEDEDVPHRKEDGETLPDEDDDTVPGEDDSEEDDEDDEEPLRACSSVP